MKDVAIGIIILFIYGILIVARSYVIEMMINRKPDPAQSPDASINSTTEPETADRKDNSKEN